MRPSVGSVIRNWASDSIDVWTVTTVTVDFVPEPVKTNERTLKVMVQPAKATDIKVQEVDWSLDHILIYSQTSIAVDELIEYNSTMYSVIQADKFGNYGFTEVVAEELRETA